MAYTESEARQELLESVAEAVDELGSALTALSEAFEQLDEAAAGSLEADLFGPVQSAYGRLTRTYAESARAHGLPSRAFEQRAGPPPSVGVRGLIDEAVDAAMRADGLLAAVQDSPKLIELGDSALRAGLTETRAGIGGLRARARELARTLGR